LGSIGDLFGALNQKSPDGAHSARYALARKQLPKRRVRRAHHFGQRPNVTSIEKAQPVRPVTRLPTNPQAIRDNVIRFDEEKFADIFVGSFFSLRRLPFDSIGELYFFQLSESDTANTLNQRSELIDDTGNSKAGKTGWAHLFKGPFAGTAPGAPADTSDGDYFYVQTAFSF